jgi:hypothetical protein
MQLQSQPPQRQLSVEEAETLMLDQQIWELGMQQPLEAPQHWRQPVQALQQAQQQAESLAAAQLSPWDGLAAPQMLSSCLPESYSPAVQQQQQQLPRGALPMQAWSLAPPQPHFPAPTAATSSSICGSQQAFTSLDIPANGAASSVPWTAALMPSILSVSLAPPAQRGVAHRQGIGALFPDWAVDDDLDAFLRQSGL